MPHIPRKQPRQQRALATRDAIIEAAARLLETGTATSTNHIAARAGVSIGSLYQYFPDKQAIFAALIAREWQALEARIATIMEAPPPPRAALTRAIDAALAHQFARPRLALALERLETGLDTGAEAEALSTRLAETLAPLLRALCPGAGTQEARDVVTLTRALINDAALTGAPDETPPDLPPRLHAAAFGYLAARGAQIGPQTA